jgi:tetratricopeptide (TPR) repeat protein
MRAMKCNRVLGGIALCAACATAPSMGWAQAQGDLSQTERDELARSHFRAGTRYFELRRYVQAAEEFERVFELSGQGALLYNAGRAWEAAGRARDAMRAYERFLETRAEGVDRASVQSSINALRARADEESRLAAQRAAAGCPEPVTAATTTSATNTSATNTSATNTSAASTEAGPLLSLRTRVTYEHRTLDTVAPWVLLGVGGLLGGLSAWQGASYAIDAGRVSSATVWSQDLTISQDSAREASRNAIIAGASGGTFVLAGVLWVALRGPGQRREELLRTAWVAPTAGGVIAGGRF